MDEIKKQAQEGDAKAQYEIGQYFEFGKGVAQDFSQAKNWYEKAAEQGLADAQYNFILLLLVALVIRFDCSIQRSTSSSIVSL